MDCGVFRPTGNVTPRPIVLIFLMNPSIVVSDLITVVFLKFDLIVFSYFFFIFFLFCLFSFSIIVLLFKNCISVIVAFLKKRRKLTGSLKKI